MKARWPSKQAWLMSEQPSSGRQAALGRAYRTWLTLRANRLAMIGLTIVLLLIFVAIFANHLTSYSPTVGGDLRTERLLPPSLTHWMGTDEQSRDIFSRVVYGSRLTLMVVALVAIIATPIGLFVGTTAGYLGGWVDTILLRITDIFLAFPRLILALAFVAALGPGIENAIIAIAITSWPAYARLARAETLTIRDADYICAIRLQGAGPVRIIWGQRCTDVFIIGHRTSHLGHGWHHFDCRRARVFGTRRSTPSSRVGCHDCIRTSIYA